MEENKEFEAVETKDLDSVLEELCGTEEVANGIGHMTVV